MEKGQFGCSKALNSDVNINLKHVTHHHLLFPVFSTLVGLFLLPLPPLKPGKQQSESTEERGEIQQHFASGRSIGADDGKKNEPFVLADFNASSWAFFNFSLTSTISMTIGDTAAGLPHNNGGERKGQRIITSHTQVKILGICLLEKERGVF